MWFRSRKSKENDLERELQAHLDLEAQEQREGGLSAEESHYAARRALGNTTLIQEETRHAWGGMLLETSIQDVRYAFRSLRGSPVFSLVAIISLALGIGANTAIFSFVNAILLKALPVPDPTQLMQIVESQNGKEINSAFSLPFLAELDKQNAVFNGVLGRFPVRVNLNTDSRSEPLNGEVVTGNYFRTLQVKPALGRLLTQQDIDQAAGNPVCVISYSTWQTIFGGDEQILGRKVLLNSHPYLIVGVTQKGFSGPQLQGNINLQLPVSRMGDFMGGFLESGPAGPMWKSPGFTWLEPLARLKPGVTAPQAQASIDPLAQAIRLQLRGSVAGETPESQPTSFQLTGGSQGANNNSGFSKPVSILMGIVALVLLIACANLATLLLARAEARAKEFAMRLALGASRLRLIRQLMAESLVLAGCGGLLGVALALWLNETLLAYVNTGLSGGNGLRVSALNLTVLSFSFLVTLLTGTLFGLAPAWQSTRTAILPEVKGPSGKSSLHGAGARRCLIVAQIALSLIILFAAGLLIRTLRHLKSIDLGFDPANVITLRVDPAMNGYKAAEIDPLFDRILDGLRAQPGITSASLAVVVPLEGEIIALDVNVPGHASRPTDVQTAFNMIGGDYFRTINQALMTGRDFTPHDVRNSTGVAIVNERFVAQFMPGQNPIGRHFRVEQGDKEIVGLVKDTRYQTLRETLRPVVYLPVKQTHSSGYALFVRSRLEQREAIARIEQVIHSLDPRLPIYSVVSLQDQIDRGISPERILSFLSILFSGLATLLCSMGLYGLIAYSVTRRTREIGIRFAIGAQRSDVARLFLRDGAMLVVAGLAVGVPLALASTRALKSLLYGVKPADALTLVVSLTIFLLTGLLASVLPVRRATRIEPLEALHYE